MANMVSTLTARLIDQISGPAKGAAAAVNKLALAEKALAIADRKTSATAALRAQLDQLAATRQAFAAQRQAVIAMAREQAKAGTVTRAMASEMLAARQKLKSLASAMAEQKGAAIAVKRELEQSIGPVNSLAAAEGRLAANTERARQALEREAMATAHTAKMARMKAESDAMAERKLAQIETDRQRRRDHLRRGAAAALAAGGILAGKATRDAAVEGAHYQRAVVGLRAAGVPDKDIAEAERRGAELQAKYTNVKRSEILDTFKELRSVLLHPQEAHELLDSTIRARSALKAIDPSGEGAHSLGFAVKGAEVLGLAQDPKRFEAFLDSFIKAKQVMGGLITPESIYDLAKYTKTSGAFLSDRFKMTTGLSLAQEMSGSTTGKSVDQFVKQLTGGFRGPIAKPALASFLDLGLVGEDQVERTKTGKTTGLKPGAKVAGQDLAMTDPDKWVYQYLLPALEKKGVTDPLDVSARIRQMFPNSNAADLVSKLITQRTSFENHAKLYDGAMGLNATGTVGKDPIVALNSLSTALDNFGGVLSSPVMEKAAQVMSGMASTIAGWSQALASFQKDHPDLSRWLAGGALVGGAAAGSAGLIGAGRWLMEGFGLKGSAAALDGSAAALTRAAVALGGAGVTDATGAGRGAPAGKAKPRGLLGPNWLASLGYFGLSLDALTNTGGTKQEFLQQVNERREAWNQTDKALQTWWQANMPGWLQTVTNTGPDSKPLLEHRFPEKKATANATLVEQPKVPYGSLTRDPSAHGDALMDGKTADSAKARIEEVKASLDQLSATTASPRIEPQGLEALTAKLREVLGLINSINGASIGVNTSGLRPKAVPAPMTTPAYGYGD